MKIRLIVLSLMTVVCLAHAAYATEDSYTNTAYFGWEGCQPMLGDYDGDGLDDLTVYDTYWGIWFVWRSSDDVLLTGQFDEVADGFLVQGDYDGDGRSDLAIYESATGKWWIYSMDTREALANGECWGPSGAVPIPGDYDGDGADDAAIYDPGTRTWNIYSVKRDEFLLRDGVWGVEGATPVSADYDGDGKADPALYQASSGTWTGLLSSNGYRLGTLSFGAPGDVPVPADYDGDGRTEPALYSAESGKYYIRLWTDGTVLEFDVPADGIACPARFYIQDVYNMAVFQTDVEPPLGVMGNSGGKFDIIIPEASSPVNNGILDKFAAISSVIAPFSFGLQVFDLGYGILQAVGVIPDPQQQMLEMLNQMDKKLDEINGRLVVIEKKIDNLQRLIEMKFEEVQRDIKWGPLSQKITTILAAHNTLRPMVSTNYVTTHSFAERQAAVSGIVQRLQYDNIQSVTEQLAVNLMAEVESSGRGFLDIYTDYLIRNHVKRGKNLLFCYLNLEYLFGRVLAHEYKGAQLTMELLERTSSAGAATQWRDSIFLGGQYGLVAQMDKFHDCVHRLVEAATDTGFYLICPPADRRFLPADVTEIYSRTNFVAAYCSPNFYHGLVGRLIGEPGRIKKYGDDKLLKATYTVPPYEDNGFLKNTRITKEVPLMRRELRTAPAMTTPYASAAEWLIYTETSPGNYHVTTTNQMAFDIFALPDYKQVGEVEISVQDNHGNKPEPDQKVTLQWRSNDYVTVVSPDTPDAVPYGYFIMPVRHYVSQHPGGAHWGEPVRRYFTDWKQFGYCMEFSFNDDREESHICHHVYPKTSENRSGDNFWFLWEDSVPINLPKAETMNNRTVGLYAKSWLEWKGNNQESQLWHTIGIGNDLASYTAQADCVHQRDVRCVSPQRFNGTATVTGNVDPARQYLSVFSSARGKCWRPYAWIIDAHEMVTVERLILYIP